MKENKPNPDMNHLLVLLFIAFLAMSLVMKLMGGPAG